ncbi:hypothetical protein [Peribacillus aracenensis]|uniref:hypothetical protein n=1 Tax=Peribacillus aracenensis TaxID=2976708 RepID=UPI0021A3F1E6|nr:hypothetical protein [Peribacillus sp. BBB004]
MLDQNTDRSWWMIGAVIVGALLIGLAKVAFPEVFEIVISFFKSMIPSKIGSIIGVFGFWG